MQGCRKINSGPISDSALSTPAGTEAPECRKLVAMNGPTIARLKIELKDVRPVVLRHIEVPLSIRLDQLHLAIQAAMGWNNSHLYEIIAGNLNWGIVDPDSFTSRLDAHEAQLDDALLHAKDLIYLYDFGDGWEHTITIEDLTEPEAGSLYPRLVKVKGRCPPDDVGGPWRYSDFLDAIRNPKHERHNELKHWIGGDFDPEVVDTDQLKDAVSALAKRWAIGESSTPI